jgi:hypothetical protein
MPVFTRRSGSALSPDSALGPIYIAGIALAGIIVLGLFVWYIIITYRRRAQAKREKIRVAAFTPVRGVFKENMEATRNLFHGA